MATDRVDEADVETAVLAVLAQRDDARVITLGEDGLPIDLPPTLDVGDHEVLAGTSPLTLALPEERAAVVAHWAEMLEVGSARITVHFTGEPDTPVEIWSFDLRQRHGACIALLLPTSAELGEGAFLAAPSTPLPPRLARLTKDLRSTILAIDPEITMMLGWEAHEMVGKRSLDFIHPDDHEAAINCWMEMLATPGMSYGARMRHLHKDGSSVWVQIVNHNGIDDPEDGNVVAEVIDISDEMAAIEALRARERFLDRLAEALPVGLFQVDLDRRVTYANARLAEILGHDPAGTTLSSTVLRVHRDDATAFDAALAAVLDDGDAVDVEVRFVADDLAERRGAMTFRALTDDSGAVTGAIATVDDVTESAAMRLELERRATFDQLTGCRNRASILDELDLVLARQAPWSGTAVVFVDLDDFKQINDDLGHAAGDAVLVTVAQRLRTRTRGRDIVGRLGGDEFLIVCPEVGSEEEAFGIATRIRSAIEGPIPVGEGTIDQQVSVGLAWSGEPVAADTLIASADVAMYQSKREHRGFPVCAVVS